MGDSDVNATRLGVARNDTGVAASFPGGVLTLVNSEIGLPSVFIRPVTRNAVLGQDWLDVTLKIDCKLGGC
jgi:hypothetical protein